MSALKTGLALTLAAFFSAACTSAPQPANQNSNTASATPSADAQSVNSNTVVPPAGATPTATSTNTDAAALYRVQMCAGCHGADGKGKVKDARDFSDPAWQKKMSDAEMITVIKRGKGTMPPYEGKLSEAEIQTLVAYIRTFAK